MADRKTLEQQALAYIRCRVQDELIVSAPEHWTTENLEAIEEVLMKAAKRRIATLSASELNLRTELDRHGDNAVAEIRRTIQASVHRNANNDMMNRVLNRLGRSGLLSDETAEQIFTHNWTLREIVDELLVGVLDCEATVHNDAAATWNERRIVRACAAVAFLSALAAAKNKMKLHDHP